MPENETVEANVKQLSARKQQICHRIEGIEAQQAGLESQVELIGEKLEGQQSLSDRGRGEASGVLPLRREAARLERQIGGPVVQASEARERLSEIDLIVPHDRPLVIARRVQTIHTNQVHVGQDARPRLSTFNARTISELFG
ncbi:hypothetical protein [Palleronia marisminoris]|uniref:hypothetical protein n=1 Tax=Palleronia marisminoris TaxID=315423 RepID=UPI001113F74F|nr:hypothetical protein [Palleronia marisminoris]